MICLVVERNGVSLAEGPVLDLVGQGKVVVALPDEIMKGDRRYRLALVPTEEGEMLVPPPEEEEELEI